MAVTIARLQHCTRRPRKPCCSDYSGGGDGGGEGGKGEGKPCCGDFGGEGVKEWLVRK